MSGLTLRWVQSRLTDDWLLSVLSALMFGGLVPAAVWAALRWRPDGWGHLGWAWAFSALVLSLDVDSEISTWAAPTAAGCGCVVASVPRP